MSETTSSWKRQIEGLQEHLKLHENRTTRSQIKKTGKFISCNFCYPKQGPATIPFDHYWAIAQKYFEAIDYTGQTERLATLVKQQLDIAESKEEIIKRATQLTETFTLLKEPDCTRVDAVALVIAYAVETSHFEETLDSKEELELITAIHGQGQKYLDSLIVGTDQAGPSKRKTGSPTLEEYINLAKLREEIVGNDKSEEFDASKFHYLTTTEPLGVSGGYPVETHLLRPINTMTTYLQSSETDTSYLSHASLNQTGFDQASSVEEG